ncbi:MAG: PQQ-binding-like beta-propeller repeat protein [Planctomycetota bacterium]|nr:PQQ-binding-like beta-propeller repeat protein [Planctomycetota bacterium]
MPQTRRFFRTAAAWALLGAAGVPVAFAQPASPVFTDDSPRAADGLVRARELASIGNLDEAVRVLQSLLDEEPERTIARADDPDLFTTVRARVHEALLADARLLDRYRALQDPAAREAVERGEIDAVERSRMLTTAGFEAALRIAQRRLESAQFRAALHLLAELDAHPERKGNGKADAAALARLVASYIDDPRAAALATSWSEASGAESRLTPAARPDLPAQLWPFGPVPRGELSELLPRPLWSAPLGDALPIEPAVNYRNAPSPPREGALWLFSLPTVVGDTLYVQDMQTLTAWNRFTLSRRWSMRLDPIEGRRYTIGPQQGFTECAAASSDGVHVAAVMGLTLQGADVPERRLVSIEASSGRVLWSRTVAELKAPELDEGVLRGPALIDDGVVVAMIDKDVTRRRLESQYAVGLDARHGTLLWVRQLGSSGALPYGARGGVSEAPLLHDGLVLSTHRMGFAACFESATGRLRWIRRLQSGQQAVGRPDQPWESNAPVVSDGIMYFVATSGFEGGGEQASIVALNAATGAIVGRCPASRFGGPEYLLIAGDWLIGVGSRRIVSGKLADFGPAVETRNVLSLDASEIRGRVLPFGSSLMVPTLDGVEVYDPARAGEPADFAVTLDKPGNVLPLEGQLIVVDDREVHTYLVWEVAEKLLRERMNADPPDAQAAITFAELAHRAGKPGEILAAVDRALAGIEADPLNPRSRDHQRALFAAVLAMIEPGPDSAAAPLELPLRTSLVERLDRCATGPAERVAYQLALGRVREAQQQWGRAVEAYQAILDAPEFADTRYVAGDTSVAASFEATRRLRRLIQSEGRVLYDVYQAEAERMLAGLVEELAPEPFEAVARRYPVARASVRAWLEASARFTTQGRPRLAAQSLEEGLAAARLALDPGDALLGELTGRLVRELARTGLVHPALRTLEEFEREHPGMMLTEQGAPLDPGSLVQELRQILDARARLPRIGTQATASIPLLGWGIAEPLFEETGGPVTDEIVMLSTDNELALFRVTGPGLPEKVWGGVRDEYFLWLDASGAYFAREDRGHNRPDHVVICRDRATGRVRWESAPFRSHFAPGPFDGNPDDPQADTAPVIDTPLNQRVPVDQVNAFVDHQTLVLLDMTGRAIGIDLSSGRVLWQRGTTVPRLHDAALEGGTLLVGGADGPIDPAAKFDDPHAGTPMPAVVLALDARTGQTIFRYDARSRVRWTRLSPEGFALVGLDSSVVALDAYRGRERWSAEAKGIAASNSGWALPGRVIVRGGDGALYQIDSETGALRVGGLDTRDRLDAGFGGIRVRELGEGTAVATRIGLALYDRSGSLVGIDERERDDLTYFAGVARTKAVTVSPAPESADPGLAALHINLYDLPSMKLLSRGLVEVGSPTSPGPFALLEGKLLISAGSITLVVDIPPEDAAVAPAPPVPPAPPAPAAGAEPAPAPGQPVP